MKRVIALGIVLSASRVLGMDSETIRLWAGEAPLAVPAEAPEGELPTKAGEDGRIVRVGNVSEPSMTVYHPPEGHRTGTCVVVCPGGGYRILAMTHEGTDVAEWLNSIGVTAVVLKYRVPAPKEGPSHVRPLLDGQRAIALVRSRAADWGVDPRRIGVLGFSAGGNLAAWLLCEGNRHPEAYPKIADEPPCRPDFGILVYPAYIADPKRPDERPAIREEEKPGPVFFAHAADDRIGPENSIELFQALRKAEVPAELHVFQDGGHGFGMLRKGRPINDWPKRCAEWMGSQGMLRGTPIK
ncbi:MAG: alpha/beta hydrolase [Verrucomicrobiae bacterium]|nr:alpha/beta hydrolase [Verrucomicrobiae bacterium]